MAADPADRPIVPAGTYVLDAQAPALSRPQRRAGAIATIVLLGAGLFTLGDFLPALAWAGVFAIGLWPMVDRLGGRFPRRRRDLIPLGAVAAMLLAFVIPVVVVAVPLIADAHAASAWLAQARTTGVPPPALLGSLPFGARLVPLWQHELGQPGQISALASRVAQGGLVDTARVVGREAVHRLVLLGFMLLALFFLLRDGAAVAAELRIGARRAFGPAGENVGGQIVRAVRATINGLVIVGLVEGVILGMVYAISGVPHPALFGMLTALLAMVPFGAAVAFLSAALALLAMEHIVAAIVVAVLGAIVMFIADHFVRPVLIGGATRLPFFWVLLGILGGVEAWGLVGLFVGPALMAALILLWREWVGSESGPLNPPMAAASPRPDGAARPRIDRDAAGGRPDR